MKQVCYIKPVSFGALIPVVPGVT